jgi:Glycosyltransferases involved in cell wall biogenesis
MEKENILLTITMLVYNDEKYIDEAILSLLNQTYKNFILIISDDCSTDKSSSICRRYAEKDKRINYIKHDKNMGSSLNFKCALDKVKTPFAIQCSGHDVYHLEFLEKLLPIIQTEDLVLVYSQSREIKMDRTLGKIYQDDYSTSEIEKPADRYMYILKNLRSGNIFQGIWKTEVLKKCYWKPVISDDFIMLLRAALIGKFKQYQSVLFFRRTTRKQESSEEMYRRQYNMIYGRHPEKPPRTYLIKNRFIFENVKILFKTETNLSLFSKLNLSVKTIYARIRKFYIKFSFGQMFRKIL